MYPVSETYENEMNKALRGVTYVEIKYGLTDPDAPLLSTITDDGSVVYSNSENIDGGFSVSQSYETLEHNRFYLNGQGKLKPNDAYEYQGYVSDELSNSDSEIERGILVDFGDNYFEFAGLSFSFDESKGDYPSKFELTVYLDDEVVLQEYHYPTDDTYVVPTQISTCNKFSVTFLETNVPNRRVRVTSLVFGILETLTTKDIIEFNFDNSVDLVSSSLPTYDFSFSIFDVDGKYDPEKEDNLLQYLENGQPVSCTLIQQLSDGTTYSVPLCSTYTTGDVSISKSGYVKTITVESSSVLEQLTMTYTEDDYDPDGKTLYDICNNLMDFAGYSNIIILDDCLKDITTKVLLNGYVVKEALQLIANYANCTLCVTRDGIPEIKGVSEDDSVFDFSFSKMSNSPDSERLPRVKDFTSIYYNVSVSSDTTSLTEVEIEDYYNTEITIIHSSNLTNITYSTSSGLSLVETVMSVSGKSVLILSGSGTLTISGNQLDISEIEYVKSYNLTGSDLEMSSILCDNITDCERYCDAMSDYFDRRSTYSFENRGYPWVDNLDDIILQTNYDGEIGATMVKNKITYNGALKGESSALTKIRG